MKKLNKIIKGGLLALVLSPIALETSLINASEVETYDLPGTGDRPQDPDNGNGENTPSDPGNGENTPSDPGNGDNNNGGNGGSQNPEVPEPVVTVSYDYTTQAIQNLIIKESEVNDVLSIAEVEITETENTFTNDVISNTTTIKLTPTLVSPITTSGVQTVVYTDAEGKSNQTWTINVNVVSEDTIINNARTLAFNIANPDVTITQAEALAINSYDELISLCGVSAQDTDGNNLTVVLPKQVGAIDVRSGKIGTHKVEFGTPNVAREIVSDVPFIVSANVTVTDSGLSESIPSKEGLVPLDSLRGDASNPKSSSGVYGTNSGVATGSNNNILPLTVGIGLGTIALVFVNKKRN